MESTFSLLAGPYYGIGIPEIILTFVLFYLLPCFFLMKLFAKAGVEGWRAWVPFHNTWTFLELGGYSGWITLLLLVPGLGIITFIFTCIAAHEIGNKLSKSGIMVLGYILFVIVWLGVCGLDSSTWNDS
ncbi:MAG: DUF5684 domain-containing protein, partial [Coriobacteriales bacterium]|nr:DUF5684 domain-containing protein [Coriobacteriales bacterium]